MYDVTTFGAIGDGVADDAPEIQAAIDACSAAGGGKVYLPARPAYRINSTLTVAHSCVHLEGDGRGSYGMMDDAFSAATRLQWGGTDGGTMVKLGTGPTIQDSGISGLALISGNWPYSTAAGIGIDASNLQEGEIDVCTKEFKSCAVVLRTVWMSEISVRARQINMPKTVLKLTGVDASNDCAHNMIKHFSAQIAAGGIGIDWEYCDDNRADFVYCQVAGAGVAWSMIFRGANNPYPFGAGTNVIRYYSQSITSPVILSEGTNVKAHPAQWNQIELFDAGNSSPNLSIGPGASFGYATNKKPGLWHYTNE